MEMTLDRENISNYLLNVVAYNTAPAYDGTENYASLQILVKVEDVNDNPPFFIEPVGGYSAVIPEDTRNGSFVLELNAQDPDTTSELFYSITSGNMDDTFTIDSRSGIIRVKKTLDFEETQKYDLVVEVSDSEWTASTSVEISVLNVNDLGPVFDRSVYDVQVKENMTQDELPFSLLQVHAVEPGTDESSSISYFLSDSDNEYFSVESKTGKIFVIKPIDYDPPIGRPNWDINIFAHNRLFPDQVNYAHLHLTLTDINDNAPVLNSALMKEPQILESSCNPCPLSESCFVTSLEVVDADGPKNGPPFSIEIEGNDTSGFILDHNGTLWIQDKEFDRETRKTVTLPIRITDSGIPPLSAVSNLLIVIGDCNDNILRDGSSTIFVFRYQDFLREGIIGRAFVEDADDWDLEDKNFFWKRDDGATPRISDPNFILQEQTGILTIKEGVPAGFYELRIGVYDKHWDATATATVNVAVVDLDEEALESSLVLKLEQCQPKEFLNKHEIFRKVTARLTGHRIEDVLVFGLRPENKFDDFCMLRFLVRNQENGFVSALYLRWLLQTFGTKKFSEALGHPISEIRMHSSICQASSPPQDCGTECEVSEDQVFGVSLIDSNRTSVVGLDIRRVSICQACLLLSEASQDASSVSLEDPESFAQFNIDQTSCFEQSVLAPSIKGHLFHAELISGDPQGVIAYKGPPLPLDHEAFKSSSSSFFMLDVSQDGRLRLQIGFQGSIHHLQSDASNSFSPESEHVVDISIVDRRLVLMIDDVIEAVANVQWEGLLHIAPGYPLHIGATPGGEIRARNNPLLRWNPRNSFVGCITNIQWNGRPLSTLRSASFFSESASRSCDSSLLLLQAHKGSATLRMSSVMWIPLAIAALLFIFLVVFMLILRRRRQERDTLSSKRKSGNFDGTLKRTTRVDEHLESSALDVNKDIELRPLISSGSRSRYQRLEHQPSVDDSVPNTTLTRLSGSLPRVTSMENFLQKRKHEADELEAVAGIEDLRCYAYEGDGSYVDSLSELDIDIDVESEDDSVDFMPPDLLKLRNPKLFGISHLLQ
ncbi:unnamed protein product [Cyprideis torosa]|uniref:Uncharacterized protein n=1 Tax=Cyprideis torosa TaxID=163714 RepID=A0A7R8ZIW6_9CRUS|nr:unnamed protein product [Cyprideis torosa]CAG0887187.1 unnamed protein product [Cyprideis torosa]